MQYQFTPASERALAAAAEWTSGEGCNELPAPALLLGLLSEPECRAALMLAGRGIDVAAVRQRWPQLQPHVPPGRIQPGILPNLSADVELSLQATCSRLADLPGPLELATEHVLLGLVAAEHEVSGWLLEHGFDPDALEAEIRRLWGHLPDRATEPSVADPAEGCGGADSSSPGETAAERIHLLRTVDAAANRAQEGLRVVEDYVRFTLDDRHLTEQCKLFRHDLAAALRGIPADQRLAARETRADVGTGLSTAREEVRQDVGEVLKANLTRLQEALRSLEEFGKLVDPAMAADFKQLRYRSYTLQRAVEITRGSLERLEAVRLYVLIDGGPSLASFRRLAGSLVEAGVGALQLRDKRLDDRRLLERGRALRELTAGGETLFIVNDRPDLAALCRADGVHVGQEELTVKDARAIVGPQALIGVSTHSIEQARRAVLDGANYIGAGPTFPSGTKQFAEFPGVDLLKAVAAEIRLPAFAIGGIDLEKLGQVLDAGFTRVAIGGAIGAADDPAAVAGELLAALGKVCGA